MLTRNPSDRAQIRPSTDQTFLRPYLSFALLSRANLTAVRLSVTTIFLTFRFFMFLCTSILFRMLAKRTIIGRGFVRREVMFFEGPILCVRSISSNLKLTPTNIFYRYIYRSIKHLKSSVAYVTITRQENPFSFNHPLPAVI